MVLIWFIHNLIIFQQSFFFSIALFGKVLDLPLANSKKKQKRCLQVSLISKLIINYVAVKYTCFAAKGKISKDVCFNEESSIFLVLSKSCWICRALAHWRKYLAVTQGLQAQDHPRSTASFLLLWARAQGRSTFSELLTYWRKATEADWWNEVKLPEIT